MSYNTVQQFLQFSITSGSFNNIDPMVIQEALDVAANRIDSALRPHHTLPIPSGSVPSIVFDAERIIAAYWCWLNVGIDPGVNFKLIEKRYAEIAGVPENPASGWLGMVAYGRITVIADDDTDPTPPKPIVGVVGGAPRCWQQGGGRSVY